MRKRNREAPPPFRIAFMSVNAIRILLGRREGFGGAELDLLNIAGYLAEQPFVNATLVTVSDEAPEPFPHDGIAVVPVRPVPASIAQFGRIRRALLVLTYYARLMRTLWRTRADLYFCKLACDETILTYLVARLRRRPFVIRLSHDWEADPATVLSRLFPRSRLRTRLFVSCVRRAGLVFTQTPHQGALLAEKLGVQSITLPNAHRLPDLPPSADAAHRNNVLWIARGHPMKRPHLFIELAARLPELRFVMVMPVTSESAAFGAEIRAAAERVPNLTFIAGLPPAEVAAAYAAARAFVLTSEAEGFSNTIIEALKWSTPVLSLDLDFDGLFPEYPAPGAPPYSSPEDTSGTCPPPAPGYYLAGSLDCAADLSRRLVTDDAFFAACSAQARAVAEARFDIRQIGPNYLNALAPWMGSQSNTAE